MTIRYLTLFAGAVVAAIALQGTSAQALTMTECSAKYKAAKTDGSLNGMKWNDFRKAQCGSDTGLHRLPRRRPLPLRRRPPRHRLPRLRQRRSRSAMLCSRARSAPNIRAIRPAKAAC